MGGVFVGRRPPTWLRPPAERYKCLSVTELLGNRYFSTTIQPNPGAEPTSGAEPTRLGAPPAPPRSPRGRSTEGPADHRAHGRGRRAAAALGPAGGTGRVDGRVEVGQRAVELGGKGLKGVSKRNGRNG